MPTQTLRRRRGWQRLVGSFLLGFFLAGPAAAWDWPVSSPEAQGLDSEILARYLDQIESGGYGVVHSLLVVRHGALVSESYFGGYTAQSLHRCYSVTKSVTSALVGIARDRGWLGPLSETLLSCFPEYASVAHPDPRKDNITLDDVLTMRSGFQWDEWDVSYYDPSNTLIQMFDSPDWLKFVLDLPMAAAPGEVFNYNTGGAQLLAGVLRNATGRQAEAIAAESLFAPLEITAWRWESGPGGLTSTGAGLFLRPRDLARFGELFLRGGRFAGAEVVSEAWVRLSTARHADAGFPYSYGYQWWQIPLRADLPEIARGDDIFFAWGWGGQYVFVVPSLDLVVVSTAGNYQGQSAGALAFIRPLLAEAVVDRVYADGDVNADGVVDAVDLAILRQVAAENLVEGRPPCVDAAAGDFNLNGRLDFADLMTLAGRIER